MEGVKGVLCDQVGFPYHGCTVQIERVWGEPVILAAWFTVRVSFVLEEADLQGAFTIAPNDNTDRYIRLDSLELIPWISVKYQFNLKIQLLNYISLYWDVWFFKNTTTIVLWHWKQCFQFHLKPCLTGRNLQATCRTWGNSTSSGPACRRWRANLF